MSIKKISIIGAGQVGSNIAFLLLLKKLSEEVVLVDKEPGLAEGLALDLEDARFFVGSDCLIKGGEDLANIGSSEIVVITAGRPRSPGMSREDLIKINSLTVKQISVKIRKLAPESIVIVITNPLDLMTYVALKATGFDWKKVMGMGSGLDSSRLANLTSKKLNLPIESIKPVVLAAHGKEMLVSSRTLVNNTGLEQSLDSAGLEKLKEETTGRGARIVGLLKEGSARFGPACACLDLIESIAYNKRKLSFVSLYLDGQYGVKGVCLGSAAVIGDKGMEQRVEFDISQREKEVFKRAAQSFKQSLSLL